MNIFLVKTIFVFLIFIFNYKINCNAQRSSSIPPVDSMHYGKEEYDFMRSTLSSDTAFMKILHKRIAMGDTNAVKTQKLLNTPYELRLATTEWTDNDIKIGIYAFNISRSLRAKFEELSSSLKEVNSDSVDVKTDSLIYEMQKTIEELNPEE